MIKKIITSAITDIVDYYLEPVVRRAVSAEHVLITLGSKVDELLSKLRADDWAAWVTIEGVYVVPDGDAKKRFAWTRRVSRNGTVVFSPQSAHRARKRPHYRLERDFRGSRGQSVARHRLTRSKGARCLS